MKSISSLLIFLGLLGFSSAMASEFSPKFLSCTRSIVEQGLGGTDGFLFVARLMESKIDNESKVSHCKSFLLTSEKDGPIDRNLYSGFIKELSLSATTKDLLNSFNKPFYECRFKNIEAPIAEGLGIAKGLGAAKCTGTNKRIYILFLDEKTYNLNFISKVFSENVYVDKNNKFLDLDEGAKAFAIGEYLGEVLDTDLELDEIGTKARSDGISADSLKIFGRFKAISIEQV